MNKKNSLEVFFNPRSIAVIGASNHPGKVGNDIITNLKNYYHGAILPVNPNDTEVAGLKCYPSVLKTPQIPDLAIIVIPSAAVLKVVEECGRRGCKNLIIISSGFKEIGGAGIALEEKLLFLRDKYKLRILGPNCLGYISTRPLVNASFAAPFTKAGNVAFLSQSGALGTAILDTAEAQKLGLSYFVSLGNKSDINELDLLDFFAKDKKTKVILAYLESITDGARFMSKAREVARRKPVVVLKSGKTAEGGQAVSSHTGSMAGANEVYSAAFRQSGVIETEDVMDFFDLAEGFSYQNYPAGNRVAILTNAGGPGILLTDSLPANGLKLARFAASTQAKLKKILPPASNIHNPVDVLGDALADRYGAAFKILLEDKNIDSIIVALTPQRMTQIKETAQIIGRLKKKSDKTVILCFMGELEIVRNYQTYADNLEPQFNYPLAAVKALGKMYAYGQWRDSKHSAVLAKKAGRPEGLLAGKSGFILENICRKVLLKNKFPLHRAEFVRNEVEAVRIAKKLGYPLALKIVSPEVIHKSDVGGVRVGIADELALRQALKEMNAQVMRKVKDARIAGYILGEIVKGQEVIVGLKRDAQFGTVVMLGMGGVYTEIFKDVSFRIAPFSRAEAMAMIGELKIYPLLAGARGGRVADLEALAELLVKFGNFGLVNPQIKEIDFNPVMVLPKGKGVKIVDVRMML